MGGLKRLGLPSAARRGVSCPAVLTGEERSAKPPFFPALLATYCWIYGFDEEQLSFIV